MCLQRRKSGSVYSAYYFAYSGRRSRYWVWRVQKMGEFSMFRESRPDATGVYRYLRIMEQRELLEQFESREAENKYKMKYRITKEGRECLANWKVTLTAYADAISELVGRMEEKEAKGYQL